MDKEKETNEQEKPFTNNNRDERIYSLETTIVHGQYFAPPNEIPFIDLIDVGKLITELDKVSTKDAYVVLVDFLNNRYKEIFNGNNELKRKKTNIIKSKILRSYDNMIGDDDENIFEEFGVSYNTMKKIAFIALSTLGGAITTIALHSSNIGGFPFALSATTCLVGMISTVKMVGVLCCEQILRDDSMEEYLQKLIFDYKEKYIDSQEFKSEMYRIVDLISRSQENLKLEGDENVKGR